MLELFQSDEDPTLLNKQESDSDSSERDIQEDQEEFLQLCGNIVSTTTL